MFWRMLAREFSRAAPSGLREASLAPRRDSLPGGLLLPALPIPRASPRLDGSSCVGTSYPTRLPVRYDWHGTPIEWTTLSRLHVFGPSGVPDIALSDPRGRRLWNRAKPAANTRVCIRRCTGEKLWPKYVGRPSGRRYLVGLIGSAILLFPLLTPAQVLWFTPIVTIISAVFAPVVIILLIVMAKKRLTGKTETDNASQALASVPNGDRTPDERWLWGAICDRDDPCSRYPQALRHWITRPTLAIGGLGSSSRSSRQL